jgi:hypothetical protein
VATFNQYVHLLTSFPSVIGGVIMVILGVFYLAFEDFVHADFSWVAKKPRQEAARGVGRILTGIQVSDF